MDKINDSQRARIYISRSGLGNINYNIYKSTNAPLENDLSSYSGVEPYAVVNESVASIEHERYDGVVPNINYNQEDFYDTLSLSYDFLYSDSLTDVLLTKQDQTSIRLNILIQDNIITELHIFQNEEIKFSTIDKVEIQKYAINRYGNALLISKEITKEFDSITLGFDLKRINYIDHYESHGSFDPDFDIVETEDRFTLVPKRDLFNIYYYTCIGMYPDNSISQLSNTVSVTLKYDSVYLPRICMASDDLNPADNRFYIYQTGKANLDFVITKKDLVSIHVPNLHEHEVMLDNTYLTSFNIRKLHLPNIYHASREYMHRRHCKTLRFYHYHEDGVIYDRSSKDFEFKREDMHEVKIDMIKIYKLNIHTVAGELRNIPIDENHQFAELVSILVRVGGKYYDEMIASPVQDKIKFLTGASADDQIIIEDSATPYVTYNYTTYLYDEYGNRSTGTVVIS